MDCMARFCVFLLAEANIPLSERQIHETRAPTSGIFILRLCGITGESQSVHKVNGGFSNKEQIDMAPRAEYT